MMWSVSLWSSSINQATGLGGELIAIPYLDQPAYVQEGDINIGALLPLSDYVGPHCSRNVRFGSISFEYSESIKFAVDMVNRDRSILPNVTLGFVAMNDCSNGNIALAESLSFLPRVSTAQRPDQSNDSLSPQCGAASPADCPMPTYDVIGVVSPTNSQPTVMVSQLLTTYRIPIVGSTATSDALSDKTQHPYFLRVSPPDKYQVAAMLKFIADQGWTYLSVLYVQGSYGEKAFDTIRLNAPAYGACIAASHRLDELTVYDRVIQDLLSYPRARVVILFTYTSQTKSVMTAIRKLNATGHFIILGSEGVGATFRIPYQGFEKEMLGMFSFVYYMSLVPDFYEYVRTLNVTESRNPWFKLVWEQLFQCSFTTRTCNLEDNILTKLVFYQTASLYIDAVMTFAHGAHGLISKQCPGATGYDAKRCVQGAASLYDHLKSVSFDGYNGHVHFDPVGDVRGSYKISQIVLDTPQIPFVNLTTRSVGLEPQLIGVYSIESRTIRYTNRPIWWEHLREEENVVPLDLRPLALRGVPESACSRPCSTGEYKIQKDPACCWECRQCRDNERLVDNFTGCRTCDKFTWPDERDFTSCLEIPATHHSITDTLPLIQLCLGFAAIVCASLVVFSYVYFRDVRVIKAASRELSILQMVAIFVGYLTVVLFQVAPTPGTCGVLFFSFCLSFTWLYAPLLVKVVRIYRIFQSGQKTTIRPRFVSPQSQLLFTASLITVQVVICVYIYAVYNPTARRTQPVPTEKYVELSCDMTVPGLVSFLTYNLFLVTLCSVFAFKTRKLPDNFNESRFISMCVSTTLIIWLAFITTYFTASRDFVRVTVLSFTLLLNHTVAVVFLYAPKIYAAVYLPPEDLVTTRLQYGGGAAAAGELTRPNRVAPLSATITLTTPKF
ncbi:Metabotropic glutamate receptor 2 [Bulinus truncatus]|nr:Metabotropic glutamate receptor 2 [Bulinus truncatus]